MLRVGDIAPEIDATTTDGTRFVLSAATGLCTIVFFFPRAFTTGCTAEAEHFRDNRAELQMAGAQIVGISADDAETQCRFAREVGTRFPMIGDPDGTIAKSYGAKWFFGLTRRVTFVIGRGRRVEAIFEHRTFVPFKPTDPLAFVDEILAFVERLRQGRAGESGSQ
ncbi:MAG TPA: peroxiredoxin [Polyangiaceae bacterium]|nr:peroxiredoxin [Polyangiaceae bacterium]